MAFAVTTNADNENGGYNWEKVIDAIAHVESRHNPKARNGQYVGMLQIGPGMVTECNNILKKMGNPKRYILGDRYDPAKSKEMFILFQRKYNPENDVEKAIRMWNGGPRFSKGSTDGYYRKVKNRLDS